jgi:RNA polymerase primary sigma factor
MKQIRIEKKMRNPELDAYFRTISHFPVLTGEQETNLMLAAQNGDKRAKDMLINCNLRFVASVAKQYEGYCGISLTISDLLNEGSIGLVEAIDTFDVTRGFKFISHAVFSIRKYILDAIKHKSRIVSDYHQTSPNSHDSLDAPAYDDSDTTLADVYCQHTDKESNADLLTDILRAMNAILTIREKTIVCDIFGIDTIPVAKFVIAERLGMTEERVRQIFENAIKKIKANDNAMMLLVKYI